jgi:hypothetical protein
MIRRARRIMNPNPLTLALTKANASCRADVTGGNCHCVDYSVLDLCIRVLTEKACIIQVKIIGTQHDIFVLNYAKY